MESNTLNLEQTDPEEANLGRSHYMLSRNITRIFLYLVCPVNTPRVCVGGGGGNLGIILVRVCEQVFMKPTLIIYLVFEKMTYSYT